MVRYIVEVSFDESDDLGAVGQMIANIPELRAGYDGVLQTLVYLDGELVAASR